MNKNSVRLVLPLLLSSGALILIIVALQQPKQAWASHASPTQHVTTTLLPVTANNLVEPSAAAMQDPVNEMNWYDVCVTQRMEIRGIGMGNETTTINPRILSLSDPASVNELLAQVTGRLSTKDASPVPDSVTFTTDALSVVMLTEPYSTTSDAYIFQTNLQPTGWITAFVDNPGNNFKTPRGFILYAKRDTVNEEWTSVGKTRNNYVYAGDDNVPDTHTEILSFPVLAEATDLIITAAVIDNNNDDRPLELVATAGGITASETITGSTDGDLLNIIPLTLAHVPTNTDRVTVTLRSPPEDDGDSLVLVGLNVSYLCADDADLAIRKTVNNSTPNVGEIITYIVTVTNNGPRDATGVRVTDELPTGVTYVPPYPTSHGGYDDESGVWMIGDLDNGANTRLTITVKVNSCTNGRIITNTARISIADQPDPNLGNNEASADINVTSVPPCFLYLPIIYNYKVIITNLYLRNHTGGDVSYTVQDIGTKIVPDTSGGVPFFWGSFPMGNYNVSWFKISDPICHNSGEGSFMGGDVEPVPMTCF